MTFVAIIITAFGGRIAYEFRTPLSTKQRVLKAIGWFIATIGIAMMITMGGPRGPCEIEWDGRANPIICESP